MCHKDKWGKDYHTAEILGVTLAVPSGPSVYSGYSNTYHI